MSSWGPTHEIIYRPHTWLGFNTQAPEHTQTTKVVYTIVIGDQTATSSDSEYRIAPPEDKKAARGIKRDKAWPPHICAVFKRLDVANLRKPSKNINSKRLPIAKLADRDRFNWKKTGDTNE
jgi:hypothetical protein